MRLLQKEKWWIWLISMIASSYVCIFLLGNVMEIYRKDAWYTKWQYWLVAFLCCVFPFVIMLEIFFIQSLAMVASRLSLPGREYYLSPYLWILCVIIPIFGWIAMFIGVFYLMIGIIIQLHHGKGEAVLVE